MTSAVAAAGLPEAAAVAPTVSVVICTYSGSRWNELQQAVESVAGQTRPAHEVIVVVDHAPSLFRRVRAELPAVVALENTDERGLSGARNSGIAAARGEVVAFLDDDATAAPDWLELLGDEYDDHAVLGVGGSVVPVWQRRPRWFPPEFDWVVGCTYRGLPVERAAVRNVVGANMSFRRALFDELGGFHSGIGRIGTLPVGCEETEFCIRARGAKPGGVILYEPHATVRHGVPATRASWRYFISRCYAEGLSKSQVARVAGRERALASERLYTRRTLPAGFLSGLLATVTLRDPAGALRSVAIVVGLVSATIGFCVGQIRSSDKAVHRRAEHVEAVRT